MAKVTVNAETCVGCGLCEQLCPEVFKIEDSIAKTITSECSQHDLADIASQCPVEAITVG